MTRNIEHHKETLGTGRSLICICLYIHWRFSGVTSPPNERMTEPPLQEPTLQQSSKDRPFIKPYMNPLAKRSPAPVASQGCASPMAESFTVCRTTHSLLISKLNYSKKSNDKYDARHE